MPQEATVEEPAKPEAPAKKSAIGNMLLIVVIALIASAGGGVLSWFLISKTIKADAHSIAPVAATSRSAKDAELADALEKGGALPLEPFIVNLADTDAARYLRIKVSLMIDDKEKIKDLTDNTALQLKMRDVILETLTQKTSQDLINEDGKKKLRQEIQDKIGGYFKKPRLVDVMFTEFVIQL